MGVERMNWIIALVSALVFGAICFVVSLRLFAAAATRKIEEVRKDYEARKVRYLDRAEKLGGPELREKTRVAIERMELERGWP
jgi:hypothetical protein